MNQATIPQRVLVVEDDEELAAMVFDYLTLHKFEVSVEERGDQAAKRILDENPDAVLLDINLPVEDGFSVCKKVRPNYRGAIIMLTARGEEVDEVVGLELGADDYMAKPIRPRALLARLRAHLRRTEAGSPDEPEQPIVHGCITLDPARWSATLEGEKLDLTTAEFELLMLLMKHAGKPLSRNDIFQKLHGVRYDGQDRSIDLRVSRLRKKLNDDPDNPERIKSVRGVGYMLSIDP